MSAVQNKRFVLGSRGTVAKEFEKSQHRFSVYKQEKPQIDLADSKK